MLSCYQLLTQGICSDGQRQKSVTNVHSQKNEFSIRCTRENKYNMGTALQWHLTFGFTTIKQLRRTSAHLPTVFRHHNPASNVYHQFWPQERIWSIKYTFNCLAQYKQCSLALTYQLIFVLLHTHWLTEQWKPKKTLTAVTCLNHF